ncbi:MAG TPA: OmpA family protein [Terriglobales bacterium]|nr:OmpA family protein [Terriglobales bacterium]
MSSQSKSHRGRVLAVLPAMIAVMFAFATAAAAQEPPPPKWELFGGYSVFDPGADVHGQLPGALFPLSSRLEWNPRGVSLSATYDFNRWLGLTLDASTHWGSGESGLGGRLDDAAFSNLSLGPKITFRHTHFSPFLEFLVGDHRLMPDAFHDIDKVGFMVGGGLDINVSRHIALRLLRADFVYSNYQYGSAAVTPRTEIRGVRLQTGINFMWGGKTPLPPPPPNRSPTASCSVDKSMVYAGSGDFAVVRASASDPDNDPLTYSWTTNGGAVEGSGPEVRWNSSGLTAGTYTAKVRVTDGRGGTADCAADIRVEPRPNRPPTMSCSADRNSVLPGESVQIMATASDPDDDPLTYSWNSSGGEVRGTGASAKFDTHGLKAGRYSVTGHVDDGRGGTADCQLAIELQEPPPPPRMVELEKRLDLHSIYFPTARPSAANPNGGLVASQEQILLTLATDFKEYLQFRPDAHLILGGHADERGSQEYNKALTERRVERTRNFLVQHGVPAKDIETRSFGKDDNLSAKQVKEQMEQNPDLTPADRKQMLGNLQVMVLANNRRVDVALSTTGQQSTHRYPFNAKDYLALINTKSGEKKAPAKKKPRN